ncbi:MAG: S8 family serine peptidase [Oligoflexia bacterium]|nr:S8 family serine peptidase [Oligoflexia bacterium]
MALVAPKLNNMPKPQRYNRVQVINFYKEVARLSVQPLLEDIQNGKMTGVKVKGVYWLNSSVALEVTPIGLKALAQHPSVTKIYRNARNRFDPIMGAREGKFNRNIQDAEHEYSVTSLGLDKLFKEKPQINGKGVIVGVVDTGVDGNHPALQGKVASFFNGETHSVTPPKDFDSHGTHVCGTIAGGDRVNNWIGVAPGARLAVAGALINYDTMIEGMQWFLDIQNNPQVGQKVKAVSNSWNSGGAPDQEVFYRAISAWEAAGILPVFSAGNRGPSAGTITNPHEYPGAFAVAAYGADGKVARFSSRGPGMYKGQPTKKPDIAAPGVSINSSIPGGKYARYDGTSMATPHVTGAVALLLQVNPNLNPAQLREILVKSATIPPGNQAGVWSADWGYGQLNVYAAVNAVLQFSGFLKQAFLTTPSDLDALALSQASLGEVAGANDLYVGSNQGWALHNQLIE